jgi:hypothetical protein
MPSKKKTGLDDYLCTHSVTELLALPRVRIETEPDLHALIEELSTESDSAQVDRLLKIAANVINLIDAEIVVKKIATRTGLRIGLVREQVAFYRSQLCEAANEKPPAPMPDAEQEEALHLLQSPDLLQRFLNDTEILGCVGQSSEKTTIKLAAASGRLSDDPINIVIKGESAAGKNFLLNSVLQTEPPEDVIDISRMTAKALQYRQGSLKHKIVAIAEVRGSEDADYSIRTFQSEKKIKIWTVEKNADGKLETQEQAVEGPTVFFQTTTKPHLHMENETRCFDLFVDETEGQTKKIQAVQSQRYTDPMPEVDRERILRPWRNAARLLVPMPVLIPFAARIQFPTRPLRVRRDYPRVLSLVEASALLHQRQRQCVEKNGRLYLVATVDDYAIARELVTSLLESVLSGATPKCKKLIEWAKTQKDKFSKREVDVAMNWTRKTALKYLREAIDLACVGMNAEKVEKSGEFWFVTDVDSASVSLPPPEELAEAIIRPSMEGDK